MCVSVCLCVYACMHVHHVQVFVTGGGWGVNVCMFYVNMKVYKCLCACVCVSKMARNRVQISRLKWREAPRKIQHLVI